jgi:hypothetical protein
MFIITRAPLSIPLFVKKDGEHYQLVSMAISKSVSVMVMPAFMKSSITVKYSQVESVSSPSDIRHPFLRSLFKSSNVKGVELAVVSDVNSGYGLSSKPAFAVACSLALDTYKGRIYGAYKTAKDAMNLDETYRSQSPFIYQNYHATANGGLKLYEKGDDSFIKVDPLVFRPNAQEKLTSGVHLYIGEKRGTDSEWKALLDSFNSACSDHVGMDLSIDEFLGQAEKGDVTCLHKTFASFWNTEKGILLRSPLVDLTNAIAGNEMSVMILLDSKGYCLVSLDRFEAFNRYGLSELPYMVQQAGARVISEE